MDETKQTTLDSLSYYFVIKQELPEGGTRLSLSSYALLGENCETLPFDTETDTALYLLDEFRKGAVVSEEHIAIANAIIDGDKPMFLWEEKVPDNMLLLSLHTDLPPDGSGIVTFGSRSPKWLARFLLRRLHESKRVTAKAETIQQAQALLG
ncbi:MAG TPA: hypothetical protein VFV38_23235 [Ktedonobacteraceae bacterium]|nr:hypothetical protein [Ktedonobacteraceae bacterium]